MDRFLIILVVVLSMLIGIISTFVFPRVCVCGVLPCDCWCCRCGHVSLCCPDVCIRDQHPDVR